MGFFLLLFALSSCSKFQQIRRNPNLRVQLEAAHKYYQSRDYYKAALLFQDLIPIYRGRPEAQDMQFAFAYCHYHEKDFTLASHYFKTYFDTYRRSERAEEALYRSAEALCFNAPDPHLDQQSTKDAIQALQGFINLFPQSEYMQRAVSLLNEQQKKLEQKAFDAAKLYEKVGMYAAAIIAFENFENDYPDSELRPEAHYLAVKSAYAYANGSALHKQEERFRNTIERCQNFVDKYPEHPYARDADNLHNNSQQQLNRLSKLKAQIEEERKQAEERERKRRESLEQREQEATLQQ